MNASPEIRVAFMGTDGHVGPLHAGSPEAAFTHTGHNTGNLAFQYAAWRSIQNQKTTMGFDFDPEWVNQNIDVIVLPAANFLYSHFDFSDVCARLERTKVPVCTFGLGCQAFKSINEIQLKPGTQRFIDVLFDRAPRVGVRGRFTADFLEKIGKKNYVVCGCPSNFISEDVGLGRSIGERIAKPVAKSRMVPTFFSYNAEFECRIWKLIRETLCSIVVQDPLPFVRAAFGKSLPLFRDALRDYPSFLNKLPEPEMSGVEGLLDLYLDADRWIDSHKDIDLVVGSRIHGLSLGWQSGTPGILVSYDLRTQELAETMGLPWISPEALAAASSMEDLRATILTFSHDYDQKRKNCARDYLGILVGSGLAPASTLVGLAAGATGTQPGSVARAPHLGNYSSVAEAQSPKMRAWGALELYNVRRIAGWVACDQPVMPRVEVRIGGGAWKPAVVGGVRSDIKPFGWGFSLDVQRDDIIADVMKIEARIAFGGPALRFSGVTSSFRLDDQGKVLKGKDGWLFLNNDTNGVISQITGKKILGDIEVQSWRGFFAEMANLSRAHNIQPSFLVAPNKESVYTKFLPDEISVSDHQPWHTVRAAAEEHVHHLPFVYPGKQIELADASLPCYTRGDTHWTHWGAYIAFVEWAKSLSLGISPDYRVVSDFGMEVAPTDLLPKLFGRCLEQKPVLRHAGHHKLVQTNGVINTGCVREFKSLSPTVDKKILVYHDSFMDWMIPYIASCFRESVFCWRHRVGRNEIAQYAPDVILIERAERFLFHPSEIV